MNLQQVKIACLQYDHTLPLFEGAVSRNVARMFPDYAQVERDYYRRTGIFPMAHTLVVWKELISGRPELATAIYAGFSQAKNLAMQRYKSGMVEQNIKSLVPWLTPVVRQNAI